MTASHPAPVASTYARSGAPLVIAALPALLVGLAFLATMLIVPVLAPIAVGDDWVYARSVEILLQRGELRILDLSVVTLVAQVLWGALFSALFGSSFGALRIATVIVTLLGGLATYGVARELGVSRGLSALAMAAALFNPLAFVLSYTFMTDPYFTAVMMLATLGYVRGLRDPDAVAWRWLIAGSGFAALAFLVRQQGVLIPLAVVAVLALRGMPPPTLARARLIAGIAALPALTVLGYYLWLFGWHGVPEQQTEFTARVLEAGLLPALLLTIRIIFVSAMYIGLFTLPLTVAAAGAVPRAVRELRPATAGLVLAVALMLGAGIWHFNVLGDVPPPMPRMPYLPQYLGPAGLSPSDFVGIRAWLVSWEFLGLLTAISASSALLASLLVSRRFQSSSRPLTDRAPALLVLAMLLIQIAGILPPSFHFRDWIISVDRYLLPLLPLALCLIVWAIRDVPVSRIGAWVIVGLFAWVSIAGTRDALSFQTAIWDAARRLVGAGVPLTAIDAGAAWDGYHLYDYSVANDLDQQTPGGPWWTDLFAPATTSEYIIGLSPVQGYDIIEQVAVPTWLDGEPVPIFVLHRQPPRPSP